MIAPACGTPRPPIFGEILLCPRLRYAVDRSRGPHRRDTPLVLKHHEEKIAEMSDGRPPPPLGLHLLHGRTARLKSENMIEKVKAKQVALGLLIAQKDG